MLLRSRCRLITNLSHQKSCFTGESRPSRAQLPTRLRCRMAQNILGQICRLQEHATPPPVGLCTTHRSQPQASPQDDHSTTARPLRLTLAPPPFRPPLSHCMQPPTATGRGAHDGFPRRWLGPACRLKQAVRHASILMYHPAPPACVPPVPNDRPTAAQPSDRRKGGGREGSGAGLGRRHQVALFPPLSLAV